MNQNSFKVLILAVYFISCSEKEATTVTPSIDSTNKFIEIPETTISKDSLVYNSQESVWKLNNRIYSGYAINFYNDGQLKEKFGILNGKKQNQSIYWYSDGHYKDVANYYKGKLSGDKKTWSSDSSHTLLSHLKYVSGKPHGEQIKWYSTGELFKKLNLNMGKEEGIQQAYRKNGVIYANYEAREGRIFGLKKAALCFGLEKQKIKLNE